MRIAIITFEGFNEIDSFVALNILNRVSHAGWKAELVAPTDTVASMNGVTVRSQQPFSVVNEADVVLVGSGRHTREIVKDDKLMARFRLDTSRQLVGSQCSGALVLQRLGLVEGLAVCTDNTTRPWLVEAGACVLDQPFFAHGNLATAGGCLSAQYLAAWVIWRCLGRDAVVDALRYVAPVGEEQRFIAHALAIIAGGDTATVGEAGDRHVA